MEWASEEMKGDRELCMAAVAQDGMALEWASEEMKGDRELCTAAVAQNWRAFEFASNELKNDESMVMAALEGYKKDVGMTPAESRKKRLHRYCTELDSRADVTE